MNEQIKAVENPEEKLEMVTQFLKFESIAFGTITVLAGVITLKKVAAYTKCKVYQEDLVALKTSLEGLKYHANNEFKNACKRETMRFNDRLNESSNKTKEVAERFADK